MEIPPPTLDKLFRTSAKKFSHRTAVVTADGTEVSYRHLDDVTDILAAELRRVGVEPERTVVLFMDRCLEFVIAYIATLKAGGAYVALEVTYPGAVLGSLLQDSKPVVCVTTQKYAHCLTGFPTIVLGKKLEWVEEMQASHMSIRSDVIITADTLAYIAYTSGTTGSLKGVAGCHGNLASSLLWWNRKYPYPPEGGREACNIAFVWELLRPLLAGSTMYVVPDAVISDPWRLCASLQKWAITRIFMTSSVLELILDVIDADICKMLKHMRTIILCGEPVSVTLARRAICRLPGVTLLNLYGISEAVDVACADLTSGDWSLDDTLGVCPVGLPAEGVTVYIRGADDQELPPGEQGEICISGPTVAREYVNNPVATQVSFPPPPSDLLYPDGALAPRLYRTGDLGVRLAGGGLVVTGRTAMAAVNINGFSVNLQNLQKSIECIEGVHACAVAISRSNSLLHAFVTAKSEVTSLVIRHKLNESLPNYMIPARIIMVKSFPICPISGKTNIKQLIRSQASNYVIPCHDDVICNVSAAVAAMWRWALQDDSCDVTVQFCDAGGKSLQIPRLLDKLNKQLKVKVSVYEFLHNDTLKSLTNLVKIKLAGNVSSNVANHHAPSEWTEYEVNNAVDLEQEVTTHALVPPEEMSQLAATWRWWSHQRAHQTMLLTGATGFLGVHVLHALLGNPDVSVVCLVRCDTVEHGQRRLLDAMAYYKLRHVTDDFRSSRMRVLVIPGDIQLPQFGLPTSHYRHLANVVDCVIHSAACVNLLYPYEVLKKGNVEATSHVINFCVTSRLKTLHHISSASVFSSSDQLQSESDLLPDTGRHLANGYSQTKWVAERLTAEARKTGLPVIIYRPGLISPSRTAHVWNPTDALFRFLCACAESGEMPEMEGELELSPVDFVAEFIVQRCKEKSCGNTNFNLINPSVTSLQHVVEMMNIKVKVRRVPEFDCDAWAPGVRPSLTPVRAEVGSTLVALETTGGGGERKATQTYPAITNNLLGAYVDGVLRQATSMKMDQTDDGH